MVKYNWKKLNNYFKWRPPEVLKYFYYASMITVPAHIGKLNKADRIKLKQLCKDSTNYSFLINPQPLLLNHSNVTEMYNYIHIASLRSLFDYTVRKVDWVELWQIPNTVSLDSELLIVKNNKVYLKYDSNLTGEYNG
jgi:hypothetical protein